MASTQCTVDCVYFMCYSNVNVTELPLELGKLQNCWELSIKGLKLTNVPQHVRPGMHLLLVVTLNDATCVCRCSWWYYSTAACLSQGTVASLCPIQPDEANGCGFAGMHYTGEVTGFEYIFLFVREEVKLRCCLCYETSMPHCLRMCPLLECVSMSGASH